MIQNKCEGKGCKLKNNCQRFWAKDGVNQNYIVEPHYENGTKCPMFWNVAKPVKVIFETK